MDIHEELARTLFKAHTGKSDEQWAQTHPATRGYHLNIAAKIMNDWKVTPHD